MEYVDGDKLAVAKQTVSKETIKTVSSKFGAPSNAAR
jgi:hypothetical protein